MVETRRPHALVVGGTGMLRAAVLGLAADHEVTVIARGRRRLEILADGSPRIHPVAADYGEDAAFAAALDAAVAARGPFALAVLWIHGDREAPIDAVAARTRGRLFHVLGSAAADPSLPDPRRRERWGSRADLSYHEVILGFVAEGGRSRWLGDAEIAGGVLKALAAGAPRRIVGTVAPWPARP
jgi:NAD(P)-dependent dehydrogenase (short-subunit alcohol dehydrogenase family)